MANPFDRLMKRCVERFSPRRDGVDIIYIRNIKGHRKKRYPIDGIFDREFIPVQFESGEPHVSAVQTQLSIHKNALPFSPKRGDKVRIGKEEYSVSEAQPDSEFGLVLILRK